MRLLDKPTKNTPSPHKDDVLPGIIATVTDDKKNQVYVDLELELEPDQTAQGSQTASSGDIPPGLAASILKRQKSRLSPLMQSFQLSSRQSFLICCGLAVLLFLLGSGIYWFFLTPRDASYPVTETVPEPSEQAPSPVVGQPLAPVQAQPETVTDAEPAAPIPDKGGMKTNTGAYAPAAQEAAENRQPSPAGAAPGFEEPLRPENRVKTERRAIPLEAPAQPQETPDYYVYSGYTCEARGDYPGALGWYKQALVFDRKGYRLLNKIAFVLMRMALYEDAAVYARQSLSVKSDYIPALVNMGIIAAQQEHYDDAERYFADALARDGTNTDALYNGMLLCRKKGDYKRAAEIEQKLKALGYPTGH